ncbi:MAG: aminotransferase class V-fold PLP-dependent enzyme [Bacilli bacterium]
MNVEKIRKDFPILEEKMSNKPLIYFDNSATALKPKSVIDEIVNYYTKLSTNSHRGDYELSHKVDIKFEYSRKIVSEFISSKIEEVVFTSGTTESINLVAKSFFLDKLQKGDEIIINYAEHASNVLPWYEIAKKTGAVIIFAPIIDNKLTLDNIKSAVTKKTKLIAIAHVTNTIADVRNIDEICSFANSNGIYTVVDGAQAIPHMIVNVKDINCDFYAFSAHKMYGPTGIGILYGKLHLLKEMSPYNQGGGMNSRFNKDCQVSYKNVPTFFEAGTQNIAGVLGIGAAIEYINNIGLNNIHNYEMKLKNYALSKLKTLDNIKVYNKKSEGAVVLFNVYDGTEKIFPQDVSAYLNSFGIAVRAGDHCAKLLENVLEERVTCRASFSFYNTMEEIDYFIDVLKKCDSNTSLII